MRAVVHAHRRPLFIICLYYRTRQLAFVIVDRPASGLDISLSHVVQRFSSLVPYHPEPEHHAKAKQTRVTRSVVEHSPSHKFWCGPGQSRTPPPAPACSALLPRRLAPAPPRSLLVLIQHRNLALDVARAHCSSRSMT